MEKKNRIVLFWTLTILGFLAHSLADALPAFWGDSIVAQQGPAPVGMIAFMCCLTYLVPVVGILLISVWRQGRQSHQRLSGLLYGFVHTASHERTSGGI